MAKTKIKKLDEKEYQEFIKDLVGEENVAVIEPIKKD